jgi:hypothetical protein
MTTADQLAIVNRLLHAPAEAYTLAQVKAGLISQLLIVEFYLTMLFR